MTGQRGFFSWWFGELREVFSGRPVPTHGLAMSDKEIALIEKGVDAPLDVVPVDASDRLEQIEGLRKRLAGRRDHNPTVEVQLPSEQVMFAKVTVPPGTEPRQSVRAHLRDLTGHAPEDVVFDVAPVSSGPAGQEVMVGVALASTIDEAVEYASRWGFDPARVTSIEWPRAFRRGPDFRHFGARGAGSWLPKAAAVLAAVALVLAGAAAMRALSIRSDLAAAAQAEARAIAPPVEDMETRELELAQFAHAAAMASDLRDRSMPVWRILAETASILPADVVLSSMRYQSGQLRLSGTAGSIEALSDAMDRSAIFNAPYFKETSGRGAGKARFVMEVTVDERSIR